MDMEEAFLGLLIVISDDEDDRPDTTRSRNSLSVTPNARTSLSGAGTSTSRASPVIPTCGPRAIVFRAAKEVTRILRDEGYTFAIVGSTACYLYGNDRLPNDIDIVMSSYTCDLELLKRNLVTENQHRFQLVDAKTPGATWKVLWYQDYVEGKLAKTKVDILKPGIMNLPMIFSEAIVNKQGLPVVPMSILLLHKLQGWKDNMDSDLPRLRSKQDADARDICSLLKIIIEGMSMHERTNATRWKQFALERFDKEFRKETEKRVRLFCSRFPEYREMWMTLGW